MLPELFCERMREMMGEKGYEAFARSFQQDRCQALRLNPLKTAADGCCPAAERMPFSLERVPWAENGFYYKKESQPGKHPFHEAGVYYIQEPSAMAPATLLEAKPGERILDLCAAPGGKSTQIAASMRGQGILLSNEINPSRAKILSENIERMGIMNACVTCETPERLAKVFPEFFDRILVDAPCSGEGMFRKNDNACAEWSPENVALCADRQDDILHFAAGMLRPGGRLVYSTCTFAPLENEGSVSRFLAKHPEFHILPAEPVKSALCQCNRENPDDMEEKLTQTTSSYALQNFEQGSGDNMEEALRRGDGIPAWIENPAPHLDNTIRLWPQFVAGEGHFAAVLEKDGDMPPGETIAAVNGFEKGVGIKELGEYPAFVKKELSPVLWEEWLDYSNYIRYGDNIYRIPTGMSSVKGLKSLRPGLHVGTLKKNRFEPAHALALALSPGQVRHVWNLSSTDGTAAAYLNGQAFPAEGEKGWYLICVDGFGMGWGKLAGGIMKNHYPKGLRLPSYTEDR